MIDFDFKPTEKDLQIFARFLPAALVVVATSFGLLKGFGVFNWVLYGIAVIILFWGLISIDTLKPIYLIWMVITRCIAWLLTTLVLGIVFFIGFTLTGMVMRLVGKDPLHRKIEKDRPSYWQKRTSAPFDRTHYERQF